MECSIYKGKRKADHYLFLPTGAALDQVPADILQMLGEIELVMNLDIEAQSSLAQSDPKAVLEMIQDKGFYIQLPSKEYITI